MVRSMSMLLLLLVLSTAQAQHPSHPRQAEEDWAGSKRGGPGSKAHPQTPRSDPEFYTRPSLDLTPVGVWAPLLGGGVLLFGFAVLLRRRLRRVKLN